MNNTSYFVTNGGQCAVVVADNEKVLPDPIEIDGIRIGDSRFKIKGLIPQPQKKESFLFSKNGKWVEKDFKTILLNYLINAEEVSY